MLCLPTPPGFPLGVHDVTIYLAVLVPSTDELSPGKSQHEVAHPEMMAETLGKSQDIGGFQFHL